MLSLEAGRVIALGSNGIITVLNINYWWEVLGFEDVTEYSSLVG